MRMGKRKSNKWKKPNGRMERDQEGRTIVGQMFLGTVNLDNLLHICLDIVGLAEEPLSDNYEDVKRFDDDDEVVIYTLEGKYIKTKRKV